MKSHLVRIIAAALLLTWLIAAPSNGGAQQPHRKGRALLVGIGYYPNLPAKFQRVAGAEEDARETKTFLQEKYGFAEQEIRVLTGPAATRQAILDEFQAWLIEGTVPGDRVFFLFSGHGSQVPDANRDEAEHDPNDHEDEALVAYDATEEGRNFILDDELNPLIASLSGRLGVLVFDSCTSGTISRGTSGGNISDQALTPRFLPAPAQLAEMRAQTRSRGTGGVTDYEVQSLPPDSKLLVPRNLKLVEEKTMSQVSGLVVVSAAQAGQVAFPMRVETGYRGALSYLFNELQRRQTPTLNQLRQQLTARIGEFQQQGRLKGGQLPAFEILSRYPLGDLPLFGGAQAEEVLPIVALVNPASSLKVGLRSLEGKARYRLGEAISYEVTTSAPGYLYLLVFSPNNVATCVFPNETNVDDRENSVSAGTHRIPRSQRFYAQEPLGKDVVIALLSSVKLNLGDKEELTWDEVFARLRSQRLAGYVNQRGVGTKKPRQAPAPTVSLDDTDWQAASLVIETIAKTAGRSASAKQANARPARGVSLNLNKPKQR